MKLVHYIMLAGTAGLILAGGSSKAPAQTVLTTAKHYLETTRPIIMAAADANEPTAKAEEVAFNYKAMSRDPKKFTGKLVTVTGKVVQVLESGDDVTMRISTSGSYGDVVYVSYTRKSADESRILGDDRVIIKGEFAGVHSYQSVMAGTITLPHIDADTVEQAPSIERRSSRRR